MLSKCMVGCFLEEGKKRAIADRKLIKEFESNRIRQLQKEDTNEKNEVLNALEQFNELEDQVSRNFGTP